MVSGWDIKLAVFVNSKRGSDFTWGELDCLSFANDAVRVMSGKGFCDDWVTDYTTSRQALRRYREKLAVEGFNDILEAVDSRLVRIKTIDCPSRGVIVARKMEGTVLNYSFGVCVGRKIAFMGEAGTVFFDPELTDHMWKLT